MKIWYVRATNPDGTDWEDWNNRMNQFETRDELLKVLVRKLIRCGCTNVRVLNGEGRQK